MNSVLFQIEKLVHGMASPMVSFFHPDVFLFAQELGVNVKLVDWVIVVFYLNLKIKAFDFGVTITLNSA